MTASTENSASEALIYGTPEFYVSKLEEALQIANGQSLTFADLMTRLCTIWADPWRQMVLKRIEGFVSLADPVITMGTFSTATHPLLHELQQDLLVGALTQLDEAAKKLQAKERLHADHAIGRLTRLLTAQRAWSVVQPWFGERRKFRRSVVARVLLQYGVPQSLALGVIQEYRATKDRGFLKLISSNQHCAAMFSEFDVEEALAAPEHEFQIGPFDTPSGIVGPFIRRDNDARYWKMRAIEILLIGGHVPSEGIAFGHAMEFAWAVGRQSHCPSLQLLLRVLRTRRLDPEFVWRAMRAISRIGCSTEVEEVRQVAMELIAARNRHRSN